MKRLSLPFWLVAAILYLFLYAPIAVVIVYSFNAARYGSAWKGFTAQWYHVLLENPQVLSAAKNTLLLAGLSTMFATLLGTMLGLGLSRYSFPGKKLFASLLYVPVVVPDIVMG